MVRPVPEICIWWAISQSCLGLLCSLGPLQGPADLLSGFAVSLSTSVSEPMSPFVLSDRLTDCFTHRTSRGRENGKTGPRALHLVGNFPIVPWTLAFTWPLTGIVDCRLLLGFRSFTIYERVRADVTLRFI